MAILGCTAIIICPGPPLKNDIINTGIFVQTTQDSCTCCAHIYGRRFKDDVSTRARRFRPGRRHSRDKMRHRRMHTDRPSGFRDFQHPRPLPPTVYQPSILSDASCGCTACPSLCILAHKLAQCSRPHALSEGPLTTQLCGDRQRERRFAHTLMVQQESRGHASCMRAAYCMARLAACCPAVSHALTHAAAASPTHSHAGTGDLKPQTHTPRDCWLGGQAAEC